MKKCDYCAKEISYHEQYCCDECQKNTNKFYEKRDRFERIFSIINIIFIFAVPIGVFIFPVVGNDGLYLVSIAMTVLFITIFFLPFPVENMISKFKLKKSIFLTRIFALILLLFGVIIFLYTLLFI